MPLRIPSLLLACTSLATPVQAQDAGNAPPGWIQERPVPKPPQPVSPMPRWYEVRGGAWQVPLETLQHIASTLEARLAGNKRFDPLPPDHAIQFRGEIAAGVRIVRLFGYCSLGVIEPYSLSDAFLEVRDGGLCVFDADYDTAQGKISDFSYYAPYGTGLERRSP